MELKKWFFEKPYGDDIRYVAFAETKEEALEIVNRYIYEDDEEYYDELEDYDIEEVPIKNPEKAYKGCYEKELCPWYDF